jgi:hypothetical protein
MEKLKDYLTVDGWKRDYDNTKNDFSTANSKVKDFIADESGSVKPNAALIAGGLAAAVLGVGMYSGVENYAGVIKPIAVSLNGIVNGGERALNMIPGIVEAAGLACVGIGAARAINESDMDANAKEALKGAGILLASAGTYYWYAKGHTQGQIDNLIDLGVSIPNYLFSRLNASGLTWLNAAALVGSGVGLVKIVKGLCGKYK